MAEYVRSLITYYDILGFEKFVERNGATKVKDTLDRFRESARVDNELAKKLEIKYITFSDTIIRATNIKSPSNQRYSTGIVFTELLRIVHTYATLIQEGILVRGSVTLGDLYINVDLIFGPGLIRAYKLESQFAFYPRIIVDPCLLKELDQEKLLVSKQHDLETEKEHLSQLLRKDIDGIYYIDYLRAIESEVDHPCDYYEFLAKHKSLIKSSSSSMTSIESRSAKTCWLAHYHNSVISSIEDRGVLYNEDTGNYDSVSDLLINLNDVPMSYDLSRSSQIRNQGKWCEDGDENVF